MIRTLAAVRRFIAGSFLVIALCSFVKWSEPPGNNFFGVDVNTITDQAVPSATTSTRMWDTSTYWCQIATARGVYDWTTFDAYVATVLAAGVNEINYTFGCTPVWASSNPTGDCDGVPANNGTCYPPTSTADFTDFVNAVLARAQLKAPQARFYWEMWNEASSTQFWSGTASQLVTMITDGVAALRAAKQIVLSPSSFNFGGETWLDGYLAAGGGPLADVITLHGYPRFPNNTDPVQAEGILEMVQSYRQVLNARGLGRIEIWDTEASWGLNTNLTSATLRPGFVAKAYLLRWSVGVRRFWWYAYDNANWGTLYDHSTGLTASGTAWQETKKWMTGAVMGPPCSLSGTVWTCSLTRSGGYRATAVWNTSGSVSYPTPSWATQYHLLDGTKNTSPGATVTISEVPILLESANAF